jgi:hypothetical protein
MTARGCSRGEKWASRGRGVAWEWVWITSEIDYDEYSIPFGLEGIIPWTSSNLEVVNMDPQVFIQLIQQIRQCGTRLEVDLTIYHTMILCFWSFPPFCPFRISEDKILQMERYKLGNGSEVF